MAKEIVDQKTGEILPSGQPMGNPKYGRKVLHPVANERMAKQEFKKECDINNIMDRYKATGLLPQQVQTVQGHFANFTTVDDYYTACSKAALAQQSFDQLPSKLRKIFGNDPAKLVEFVSNPKNREAAADMGLLTPEATKKVKDDAFTRKLAADQKIIDAYEAKKATATKVGKKDPEGS